MLNQLVVLMIGDVTGEAGIYALKKRLADLKHDFEANLVVVNGENAAEGYGLNEQCAKQIFDSGADVITSGNHIWEKRDFLDYMQNESRILRPANYPEGAMGRGSITLEKKGVLLRIINLQGREFMAPIDCPFRKFDEITNVKEPKAINIVDFHAESGREKEAFAFYIDGRAAALAGTHTHVQTADERVLPCGTAYISDLGMTGSGNSVIGMNSAICLERTRTQVFYKLECAVSDPAIQGALIRINTETGNAASIERLSLLC
jgi:metallophosphoesterase (TIGR00282 family)